MSKGKQTTLFQTWGYEGNEEFLPSSQQPSQPARQSTSDNQKSKTKKTQGQEQVSTSEKKKEEVPDFKIEDDDDIFGHDDEEDELLAKAMEESLAQYNKEKQTSSTKSEPKFQFGKHVQEPKPSTSMAAAASRSSGIIFKRKPSLSNSSLTKHDASEDPVNFEDCPPVPSSEPQESIPGYDLTAGRTWIYPTNYPVR